MEHAQQQQERTQALLESATMLLDQVLELIQTADLHEEARAVILKYYPELGWYAPPEGRA